MENTHRRKPETHYVAFGGKDRVERLRIQRVNATTHAPRYLHLQNLIYDSETATSCVLVYDFMAVTIQGENLQSLFVALELGTADFIQEFDPELWPKPADDVPFIESIKIVSPGELELSEKQIAGERH